MGIDVGANFKSPYLALSVRDFWRRWHVSLSTWLRDYLYIPLGGSKKGSKTANLLITMTLGGLWHGAHLRYIFWGMAHGLVLALNHLYLSFRGQKNGERPKTDLKTRQKPAKSSLLARWGGFLFTFNFVSFTWILFRAENLSRAGEIARAALDFSRPGQGAPLLAWLIVGLTLFGQAYGDSVKNAFLRIQGRLSALALGFWLAFWVILIVKLGPAVSLPFIYFQY
jgi:hypothetical protein